MIYGKVAVGVIVGAAALASPALAQDVRKLDFGLRGQVEHNSNVARTNEAQAAARGLTRADTIFTPAATFDLLQPVGRQALFLSGSVGYSFYEKNTDLNRERYDLSGGAIARLGICETTLRGGYKRGVNQIDDPTLIDNVRNIQDTRTVALDVTCARQTGFGLVGGALKEWTSNDLGFLETSDSERTSATGGVSYMRPALGTITVFGNVEETKYPNRVLNDGYDLKAIGITLDRQLGARIQGTVTVAYTNIDQHAEPVIGGAGDDRNITAYSASLTYRASSRLRLQASFDRSVTPASGIGRTYDLTESYQLSGDFELSSRILLSAGFANTNRKSAGAIPDSILDLTDSDTMTYYGTSRYRQSDRLSFVLDVGREERTTNAPQFDYTNNRIGLTAALAF